MLKCFEYLLSKNVSTCSKQQLKSHIFQFITTSDVGNLHVMGDVNYFQILSVSHIKHEFMNVISL